MLPSTGGGGVARTDTNTLPYVVHTDTHTSTQAGHQVAKAATFLEPYHVRSTF